jgi:hypothetical protein
MTALEVTDLGAGASDVIFQIVDGLTLAAQVEVEVIKLAALMADRLLGVSKAAAYVISSLLRSTEAVRTASSSWQNASLVEHSEALST